MSPIIALISCFVFIIFLFVFDKKNKGATQWSTWIPLLWMLVAASRPIGLWLNPGSSFEASQETSDSNPFDRFFYIFLIISGMYYLLKRNIKWSFLISNNILVFLFFLFCGLSITWSDVPNNSFNAWVKFMTPSLMVLIIITEHNPIEAFKTVLQRAAYVLIPLSIVLIKYYPQYGRSFALHSGTPFYGGVTSYKNGLGFLCMTIGIFLVWDLINMLRDKSTQSVKMPILVDTVLLSMIMWLMYMANCSTGLAAFIIGVCILVFLELPIIKSNLKIIDIFVICFLSLTLFSFFVLDAFEFFVTSFGRDMTLTGRTVIWEKVLSMNSNPLIGTGFSSFWHGERGEFLIDLNWVRLTQAHNGYIQVYLDLGLIGLGLLVLMIIKAYNISKKSLLSNFQYGKLQMTYLLALLLTNITEATFVTKDPLWFIFILILIQYSSTYKNQVS